MYPAGRSRCVFEALEGRRLLAAGVGDASFGYRGLVMTDFDPKSYNNKVTESVSKVLTMPDGRVLAIGSINYRTETTPDSALAIVRHKADGSYDSTFGDGGIAGLGRFSIGNFTSFKIQDAVLQADGGIVVCAAASRTFFDPDLGDVDVGGLSFARFTSAGVLDTTFGTGGVTWQSDLGINASPLHMLALPDGKFLVAAHDNVTTSASDDAVALLRFNADGSLDTSFGDAGRVRVAGLSRNPLALLRRSDGKIVVVTDDYLKIDATTVDLGGMARLNADGTPDATFGSGDGVINLPLTDLYSIQDAALAPDGSVFLAVQSRTFGTATVVKFTPDGAIDTSFGTNGFASASAEGLHMRGQTIEVQADGKIILAGYNDVSYSMQEAAAARFNTDGTLDTSFGLRGIFRMTDNVVRLSSVTDITFDSSGRILLGGAGDANFMVARLLNSAPAAAGTVDVQVGLGQLIITGTAAADAIRVRTLPDGRIEVDVAGQAARLFASGEIERIFIASGDGNDSIDLRDLAALPDAKYKFPELTFIPVTVLGDSGADVLIGHQGRDRIVGGNDNDKIAGLAGDDWLSGNAQKDRIDGGEGNDSILGNGGGDRLEGAAGNDTILGGDQPDGIAGGDGDDSLTGEGGHDRIDGGAGSDFMYGVGGDDVFYARDGEIDTIVGGKLGNDLAQIDDNDVVEGIEQLLA
jgi:uncharacterized delta-60 repeat protein